MRTRKGKQGAGVRRNSRTGTPGEVLIFAQPCLVQSCLLLWQEALIATRCSHSEFLILGQKIRQIHSSDSPVDLDRSLH